MITYKITKIDSKTGNVSVTYTIDKTDYPQVISNLPLDNADALTQALYDYGTAFKSGKDIETQDTTVSVDQDVQALVNTVQTIEEPVINDNADAQQVNS